MMVDKFVRQLNILGMVLGHPGAYQIADLEDIFDCEALTIKRDLQELREMGIDIHTMGKKGIK